MTEHEKKDVISRLHVYLFCSFLSLTGDMLLLYALPTGLGLEWNDLRLTVLMFLVPAVSLYLASFFHGRVLKRYSRARSDYAFVLLGIAGIEILVAILSLLTRKPLYTALLVSVFVFLYAFSKEGLPRLLYTVSIYRYFTRPEDYDRALGLDHALGIVAAVIGAALAALLLRTKEWRLALILDALTFIVLGLAILLAGRDEAPADEIQAATAAGAPALHAEADPNLHRIAFIVPCLSAASCLFWPHLSIFSENHHVAAAWRSTELIAFLCLPGLILGGFFDRIAAGLPKAWLLYALPGIYMASGLLFLTRMSPGALAFVILCNGLVQGLYWPADYSTRNQLPPKQLIAFNSMVLRRFSIAQFFSCLTVILLASSSRFEEGLLLLLSLVAAVSLAKTFVFERSRIPVPLLLLAVLILGGCDRRPSGVRVLLPAITQDMRIRTDLTYPAFAVLNETSAHIGFLSKYLTPEPQVLDRYEFLKGGMELRLHFSDKYRSARGEEITAADVAESIRIYLQEHRRLSSAFEPIIGADSCGAAHCALPGLSILDEHSLSLRFTSPQPKIIDSLMNPWFVIYKKGRPRTETVGLCQVPYQTGRGLLLSCETGRIVMQLDGKRVVVTADRKNSASERLIDTELLTDNPGTQTYPTLTILAAFANPDTFLHAEPARVGAMTALRERSRMISEALHLRYSPLMTPKWMALEPPPESAAPESRPRRCLDRPFRVLLDTSLPYLDVLQREIPAALGCPVDFSITTADKYFDEFKKNDIGIAWFTPDERLFYDYYSAFDCGERSVCYFNWHDAELQREIDRLRASAANQDDEKKIALSIERRISRRGYAAPLSEMNWWIKSAHGIEPIHPSGLAQIHIGDFL